MKLLFPLTGIMIACAATLAHAADDDALDLQATAPSMSTAATVAPSSLRVSLEAAALLAQLQPSGGSDSGRRLSLDLRWTGKLAEGWRFGVSNRLDDIDPVLAGQRRTRNQLREAYVGWEADSGQHRLELGRLNQRHGPGYGYTPTDYFRLGATRSVVTADPIALRENRSGTFMLRASQSWNGGGASVAWAPRVTHSPQRQAGTWSLDLAATNPVDRILITANTKFSERWNGEALLLTTAGQDPRAGLNVTGLIGDATVLHAEWSSARTSQLLDAALGMPGTRERHQQASLGVTYSLATGLVVTAEAAFNGAGLNRAGWRQLFGQGPVPVANLFGITQSDQELASRRAWLLYASQKGLLLKQLDLTAFIRQNALDRSHLAWVELRHHWPKFDVAIQWQRSSGQRDTEYGALPYRQVIQFIGSFYF